MFERHDHDLVIIGMGSAGMVAAEFATSFGADVVVVEAHRPGGDCLWTGCVPSKALLASAKAAHAVATAGAFGVEVEGFRVDRRAVWERIRSAQQAIATGEDDPARFRSLGVDIVQGRAALAGPHTVVVDGVRRFDTRFVLIGTGSRPRVPDVEGLAECGYLTSETIWEQDEPPASVVVMGGGPIGVELAQGLARLGVTTTVVQHGPRLLPKEEPRLADAVRATLEDEGVTVVCGVDVTGVAPGDDGGVVVRVGGDHPAILAEGVIVATGRAPNVDGLGLEELGIGVTPAGIAVDGRQRTAVDSIYAVGDVTGGLQFTHAAGYDAVRAVRDMFFPGKAPDLGVVPWCTFTDPELARAGLTEAEARVRWGDSVRTLSISFGHNDRAIAEMARPADGSATAGQLLLVGKGNRIVGAHVLGEGAGELIHELALAIRREMSFSDLATLVHVYPTMATSVGKLVSEPAYETAAKYRWLTKTRARWTGLRKRAPAATPGR